LKELKHKTMPKLWTFGDSFTFGHGCNELCPSDTYQEYKSYKKKGDDIWPNILGRILDSEVMNFGKNGGSNEYILNTIIENYDSIHSDDYVVISKSFSTRMDIPIGNEWYSALGYMEVDEEVEVNASDSITEEERETLLNFQYLFRGNSLYKTRHDSWFDFIKNRLLIDKKVKSCIMWDVTNPPGVRDISEDTGGKIKDKHFSWKAHSQFSQYIYSKITPKLF
tara:strand:+ start:757 stop:1425 length:669 start_codon:yes stop_codon:yes gene_type:complete